MLNPEEVKRHNHQVWLKEQERKLAKLEEVKLPIDKRDGAGRSTLPKIDPAKRAWKRPPMFKKARTTGKVAIATQAPNYPRNYAREYLRGERE